MIFTAGMAVEDIIKMWLSSSQLQIQWTQIGLTYFTLPHVSGGEICFRTSSELDSDVSLTAVLKYLETGHRRIILISKK